jgi:ketosteroid isomerase-like protein
MFTLSPLRMWPAAARHSAPMIWQNVRIAQVLYHRIGPYPRSGEMGDTRAIATRFAQAFCDNLEDTKQYLSQDYVWWTVGFGDSTTAIFRNRAAMDGHLADVMDARIVDIIAADGKAAIEIESRARLKNGSLYHNFYHLKLYFRGDKVVRVVEYFDSAHAAAIWGPILGPGID